MARIKYRYWQGHTEDGSPLRTLERAELEAAVFTEVYRGEVDEDEAAGTVRHDVPHVRLAEAVFRIHNADHRPHGWRIRSMSVGDIVQFDGGPLLLCQRAGWRVLDGALERGAPYESAGVPLHHYRYMEGVRYPRTWLEVARHRGVREEPDGSITAAAFAEVGIHILNGCAGCQATVAPYNSYQLSPDNPYAYCASCAGVPSMAEEVAR